MEATCLSPEVAYRRITQILGCKWSLHILGSIARGSTRPSQMTKSNEGLAPRVLHRCLNRLEADGLLERTTFAEIPPRVEYGLTRQGGELLELVRGMHRLAESWTGTQGPIPIELVDSD